MLGLPADRLAPIHVPGEALKRTPFEIVLADLCKLVPDEPHPGRGPKPRSMAVVLFDCAMRIHLGASSRLYHNARRPKIHYNTALARMNDAEMTRAIWRLLDATEHGREALLKWGPLTAKNAMALVNEMLLRRLVARIVTLSGGE